MDKTNNSVFFTSIAFNGVLISHVHNLSTYHYHVTYHPCHDTARPRNNIFELLPISGLEIAGCQWPKFRPKFRFGRRK